MKLGRYTYFSDTATWSEPFDSTLDSKQTLILVFSSLPLEQVEHELQALRMFFPASRMMGASTAGNIIHSEVHDDVIHVTVMRLDHSHLSVVTAPLESPEKSYTCGISLARKLRRDQLKSVFVLSEGLNVNGSQLTKGIAAVLQNQVPVSGGLAGDGNSFSRTWILVDGKPQQNHVSAVGFYGDQIHVGCASESGWDKLGIERRITRSRDNVLYELDGQPALRLYKEFLGEKAKELPSSGLLFPLDIKESIDSPESRIRTILAVNEADQSITFAGDVPESYFGSLMMANYDRIIGGAETAAEKINFSDYQDENVLSLAVSCVGRRIILKQRTEEELESALDVLPQKTYQTGFYSYGEISPQQNSGLCDLHNQTMTLTTLWESDASAA